MTFSARRALLAASAISMALLATPPAAWAQVSYSFNIPAESLADTLRAIGGKAGANVAFDPASVRGKQAPALHGSFTVEAALEQAVAGSGLAVRPAGAGSFVIEPAAAASGPVQGDAQPAAPDPAGSPRNATEVREVVVTGSNIRGAAPVGSPVDTVTRTDIVESGATNVTELLRTVPEVGSFGASGPNIGGNQANFIDNPAIHGVGVGNGGGGLTLILLDGLRLPGAGVNQTAPDASVIPMSALERVEIVDDGASSVYGSDAVAGVINFVLRKNFDGAETAAQGGWANGYNTQSFSQLVGKTWSGGSFMADFEHSGNSDLSAANRSFINDDLTARGLGDQRSTTCSPANVSAGGVTYGLSATGAATAGVENRCQANQASDLVPEQQRNQGIVTLRQHLTSHIEAFAEVLYSAREMRLRQGADASTESNGGLTVSVPSTSPFYIPMPGAPAGATESVTYAPTGSLGVFTNRVDTTTLSQRFGLNADLGAGWRASAIGDFGFERDDVRELGINQQLALDAAAAGTLNPYGVGASTDPALLKEIGNYQTRYAVRQVIEEGLLKADGPVFELLGGTVKAAVGFDTRAESMDAYNSDGPVGSPAGLSAAEAAVTQVHTRGSRSVNSVYGEFLVPIVGANNALPGIEKLLLNVSVRYDDYSDFGGTTNPKVGINWSPVKDFVVHGSFSTSFHAPSLADGSTAIDTRAIKFADFTGSSQPGAYSVILAGGAPLKPETADNYSLGFDWKPQAIPGLKTSLNYFYIDYKNVITFPTFNPVTQPNNPVYDPYRVYSPTMAQAEAMIGSMRHDGNFNLQTLLPTAIYDLRRANFADETINGIDFSGEYGFNTSYGRITAGLSGTKLFTFDQLIHRAASTITLLNTDYAIDLKMRGSLSWKWSDYTAVLFVNYIDGYQNTNLAGNPSVSAWTTADLHLAWDIPGEGLWSKTQLALDVENLFDANPPFFYNPGDNTSDARGYDPAAASPFGRIVEVGFRKKW